MSDNVVNVPKMNRKLAVSIYLRTILAAVLGLIVYMSLSMIVTGLTTKNIGITTYEKGDDGSYYVIATSLYSDDTDTTTATTAGTTATTAADSTTETSASAEASTETTSESISQTTTATAADTTTESTSADDQYQQYIRSDVPTGASIALDIISELFMLILLIAMPYSILWSQGDKDANSVHFGHMEEDKRRGLKIALMAGIPSYVANIVLLISKLQIALPDYIYVYRFLNISFLPFINLLAGNSFSVTADISWLSILVMILTAAIIPLVGHLAYTLGYSHISISEKIIYVDPSKKRKRNRY